VSTSPFVSTFGPLAAIGSSGHPTCLYSCTTIDLSGPDDSPQFGSESENSGCRHMFHILQADGLCFLAMSDSGFERRIAYAFLDEIKTRCYFPTRVPDMFHIPRCRRFLRSYGDIGLTAAAYAMNKSFSRVLKEQMVGLAAPEPYERATELLFCRNISRTAPMQTRCERCKRRSMK
jgi:hypothetical protein